MNEGYEVANDKSPYTWVTDKNDDDDDNDNNDNNYNKNNNNSEMTYFVQLVST